MPQILEEEILKSDEGFSDPWCDVMFTLDMVPRPMKEEEEERTIRTIQELKHALVIKPFVGDVATPCPIISKNIVQELIDSDWGKAENHLPAFPDGPGERGDIGSSAPSTGVWVNIDGNEIWDNALLGAYCAYQLRVQLQALVVDVAKLDLGSPGASSRTKEVYYELVRQREELVRYWDSCRGSLEDRNFSNGVRGLAGQVLQLGQWWYWAFRRCAGDLDNLRMNSWLRDKELFLTGRLNRMGTADSY